MDIVKEFPYYWMNMISIYEAKGLSEIRGFLDVKWNVAAGLGSYNYWVN